MCQSVAKATNRYNVSDTQGWRPQTSILMQGQSNSMLASHEKPFTSNHPWSHLWYSLDQIQHHLCTTDFSKVTTQDHVSDIKSSSLSLPQTQKWQSSQKTTQDYVFEHRHISTELSSTSDFQRSCCWHKFTISVTDISDSLIITIIIWQSDNNNNLTISDSLIIMIKKSD